MADVWGNEPTLDLERPLYPKGSGRPISKETAGSPLDVLKFINSFLPVTGDIQSALEAYKAYKNKDYVGAGLEALAILPVINSGMTKSAATAFEDLAKTGKIRQAKNKEQELKDLLTGKSKFAEVRLDWDDPKSYDIADKLKKQGFESTVTNQGKDQITLFHKASEDISPVLNAKTPYDFGKAYGYSDNDIAQFYKQKYGNEAEKYWKQDIK